ncbi:MAG: GNAT family N-acetyltransferase [Bacteroidota bacterium]
MIGPNLLLRAPEPADIDTLFRWENDMRIWHLGNTLTPYSRFAIEQFVLNTTDDIFASKQLRLMIDWHSSGPEAITVGSIDLFDFDPFHMRAGIGILIDESSRQKGFASEALELLIQYCFNTLNLHQLYCNIEQGNTDSIRLFTKAGFVECGNKKEWLLRKGNWTDELIFQLIKH